MTQTGPGPRLQYDITSRRFGELVHSIKDDQWDNDTPDTEWSVRDLVNHLVSETLWIPPLFEGKTTYQIAGKFDGDVVGDDPVTAWDAAVGAARDVINESGSLEATVHLSYGDRTGAQYVEQLSGDLLLHSWDLARGIGADDAMDSTLVHVVFERMLPLAENYKGSSLFAAPVDVPDDADEQTKLLGLTGRKA